MKAKRRIEEKTLYTTDAHEPLIRKAKSVSLNYWCFTVCVIRHFLLMQYIARSSPLKLNVSVSVVRRPLRGPEPRGEGGVVCLLVACLLDVPATCQCISGTDLFNCTCCHTEIEVADQTFYLDLSQYTDTGPTSPRLTL